MTKVDDDEREIFEKAKKYEDPFIILETQKNDKKRDEFKKLQYVKHMHDMDREKNHNLRADKNIMVCTRLIGHKKDIPGSGQWRIRTEQEVF